MADVVRQIRWHHRDDGTQIDRHMIAFRTCGSSGRFVAPWLPLLALLMPARSVLLNHTGSIQAYDPADGHSKFNQVP